MFKSDVSFQLYFRVPPSRSFIIPPGGYPDEMDQRPLQGPYLFGRENTNFPEANFGYVQQYPINAVATPMVFEHPHQYDFLPRESLSTVQTADSSRLAKSSGAEPSRNRWTEGEVKLLIAIYGEEWQNRNSRRSLEPMWERIAERLVSECKEMDIPCEKSAKNCRDKMNNLNKKYKAVKDKSKMTGEGSEGIKSFPQFDDLDQIWGTRDSVNPKYVLEAGTSQPVTSTPVPSPNPSISASESSATVQPGELDESTDESDLIEESASLFSTISKSKNLSKKGKGPAQPKGKRSKPVEDQDDKTDEELERSESLFFKKKGGREANCKKQSKSKQSRKREKKAKFDEEQENEDVYAELIKAQTEALKKNEEEKKQLDYLRESDNRTQELVLGAIRELGEILKK